MAVPTRQHDSICHRRMAQLYRWLHNVLWMSLVARLINIRVYFWRQAARTANGNSRVEDFSSSSYLSMAIVSISRPSHVPYRQQHSNLLHAWWSRFDCRGVYDLTKRSQTIKTQKH